LKHAAALRATPVDNSFHLGEDGIYRCQGLQHFLWQSHGFGTRRASPPLHVSLRQVHSDVVWDAHGLKDRQQTGDALVTNECGLSIGIRTADCVPILLLDPTQRAIAAVHAGWRGTAAAVVRSAIHKMSVAFGSDPAHLRAAIGPCIRACCYQVGAEVAAHFEDLFPEWKALSPRADGKRNLNLAAANARQMQASGVPASHIFDACLCTACQVETFYSYRRQPNDPGRLISAITRIS
jgi:YfiH family protein